MNKSCTNCKREYHCDWEPAGSKEYCGAWEPDCEAEKAGIEKLSEPEMLAYTE